MNDSLELEPATRLRPAVERAGMTRPAMRAAPPAPVPVSVESRLRASLPWLFERSRAPDVLLLVDLASRRLGGLLDDALACVRSRLGVLASGLEPRSRLALQDAVLTSRLRIDELLPDAIDCLSPGELVAILADGCADHPHARMHAFRLRRAIDDRRDLLAREAMLELASNGTGGALRDALSSLVERRLMTLLAAHPLLPPALVERLRGGGAAHDRQDAGHDRQDAGRRRVEPTASEQLAQALGRGDREAAIRLLAAQAGVRRAAVETALFLRTPRGLLSLAWRAGLEADLSACLQSRLGRISPAEILRPDKAGTWPMSEAEMRWQCRFLSEFCRGFAAA